MMRTFTSQYLESYAISVFESCGTPTPEAQTVAKLLVEADLMGLPSHGILRIPQYVRDVDAGFIVPGAKVVVQEAKKTMLRVDGCWNFGQIGASHAATAAIDTAQRHGMACASLRHCRHVGRLGAYVEMAAKQGCIGLATSSTAGEGHWVTPFGGREGRLGTNPIAFAAPSAGPLILVDFSTSALPEGKVRLLRDTDESLPPDSLVDSHGKPSNNPAALYTDSGEPAGAILPFGGKQGYKGYGLGFMAQILSSIFGEPAWREEGRQSHANTMWLMVIDISAIMDETLFRQELQAMADYIRKAAPAADTDGVLLPGQRELDQSEHFRREGIPVADGVWRQLLEVAERFHVQVDV